MKDNNKWFILLAVVALVIMLTFVFFEIKDKPIITWKTDLDLTSKSAGDFMLFKSLLDVKYDSVKIIKSDSLDYLNKEESTFMIYLSENIDLKDGTANALWDYVERGNNALLISSSIKVNDYDIRTKVKYPNLDTSLLLIWNDSTELQYKKYWGNLEDPRRMTYSYIEKYSDTLDYVENDSVYYNYLSLIHI